LRRLIFATSEFLRLLAIGLSGTVITSDNGGDHASVRLSVQIARPQPRVLQHRAVV